MNGFQYAAFSAKQMNILITAKTTEQSPRKVRIQSSDWLQRSEVDVPAFQFESHENAKRSELQQQHNRKESQTYLKSSAQSPIKQARKQRRRLSRQSRPNDPM